MQFNAVIQFQDERLINKKERLNDSKKKRKKESWTYYCQFNLWTLINFQNLGFYFFKIKPFEYE